MEQEDINSAFVSPDRQIRVTLDDLDTPILILFGPKSSGKTMTLMRLAKWLVKNGYSVEPVKTFRPMEDVYYQENCNNFISVLHGDTAAMPTGYYGFMLIKVRNKLGDTVCQILDAEGNTYFDGNYPKNPFPLYILSIIQSANPKLWLFFVECDWGNFIDRINYADRIRQTHNYMKPSDKVIFICNKADKHRFLFDEEGQPFMLQFFKTIQNQYPGIFNAYENHNPLKRWFCKYNFDFIVFSVGNFYEVKDGSLLYFESCDKYPSSLWKSITKSLRKMNKKK